MANISTATVNFPGVLTYDGINVIHTAQNEHTECDEFGFIEVIRQLAS